MKNEINALAQIEWKKNKPNIESAESVNWDFRLSPPIPSEWLNLAKPMTAYAYSWGTEMGSIGRYESVASPWAKIEFTAGDKSSLKLTRIEGGEKCLGHQGMRPLQEDEVETFKTDIYDSYAALAAPGGNSAELERQILKFYKLWKNTNGVIAEVILKLHPKFAAKLG